MLVIISKKTLVIVIAIILIIILFTVGTLIYPGSIRESGSVYNRNIEKPILRGMDDSKYIAFACNVDWGNEVLGEMLYILENENVKITFFVTGRWSEKYPELLDDIIEGGHEIASHGHRHLNYSKLSLEDNLEQIIKAERIIMKHTKIKPELFSPPSGAYNKNTLIAARQLGYRTILWSIDTIDWRKGSTKDIIINRVLESENHGGSIVLMHPKEETVKALRHLIVSFREKGIEVGRVSDVLHWYYYCIIINDR